jgi:hypothetical protein
LDIPSSPVSEFSSEAAAPATCKRVIEKKQECYVQPTLAFVCAFNMPWIGKSYPLGADLVGM